MATFSRPMASSIARRALIPEDSPSFCIKIVTDNDLRDGKELPEMAVKIYRTCMEDSIFLKVPNCETLWPIEVKKSAHGGRMWLHKGWQEFANFYSLEQGYLVFVSYKGEHSHFQGRIFHWNDVEIEYRIRGSGGTDGIPKRKRTRAHGGMPNAYSKAARAISNSSGSSGNEHQNVLSTANSFKSDKPFIMIKMTAYYLRREMFISASFATNHLCRAGASCDLSLQTPDMRTWIAELIVYETTESRVFAKIKGAGWKAFKEENHLEEGDVCVLELIEECKFRVSIFRARVKINELMKQEGQDNSAKEKLLSSNFY